MVFTRSSPCERTIFRALEVKFGLRDRTDALDSAQEHAVLGRMLKAVHRPNCWATEAARARENGLIGTVAP